MHFRPLTPPHLSPKEDIQDVTMMADTSKTSTSKAHQGISPKKPSGLGGWFGDFITLITSVKAEIKFNVKQHVGGKCQVNYVNFRLQRHRMNRKTRMWNNQPSLISPPSRRIKCSLPAICFACVCEWLFERARALLILLKQFREFSLFFPPFSVLWKTRKAHHTAECFFHFHPLLPPSSPLKP